MKRFILIYLTIFLACESPFSTQPTDDDIFTVTHNYNGEKIYIPTPVTIEWSNITIKNFKEFLVERSAAYGDSIAWEERAHILDSLQVKYIDTIDDDITFQYRIRMVDQDDQYIHALSSPLKVPNVSSLKVPEQYDSLQKAFDSYFIDDGDTINVFPGLYQDHFEFLDKDVVIRAIMIPEITLLGATPGIGSVVTINNGELDGFTIIGGKALTGGGVHASGIAIIRKCIIRYNRAVLGGKGQDYPNGVGGGVFLSGEASLERCKIANNSSSKGGGGVATEGNNVIVGCTIDNNNRLLMKSDPGLYQQGGQLIIRNTKFIRSYTNGTGGAIMINAVAEIYNCLFVKNKSTRGGGLIIGETGNAKIVNCVFYKNWTYSRNYSGAIVNLGEVKIINTIVWNNSGKKDYKLYSRYAEYTTSDEFRNILVGVGNLDLNPNFVDSNAGNYHLSVDSPCVNAGHPGESFGDVDGSRNDMGIYGGPYGDDW